ncbi:MAG TPA: putative Ig domain-containing protein, partial [Kineosporiaceae bacterium]|nr:putative Ig domain-containing protein [Kineosporiaceae bacterium]
MLAAELVPMAAPASAVTHVGYTNLTPTRLLDTRSGLGAPASRVGPGGTVDVQITGQAGIPATGAAAVVLNLTVVWPTAPTYVTAYPAGAARPMASNINVDPGAVRANMVIAALGTGGKITLYNAQGATDLLVDVMGWYGTGFSYTGQTPQRVLDTRIGQGVPKTGAVGPDSSIDVQVTGIAGVPANGVAAVALNLTGTAPTAPTYLTAYPTGGPLRSTSNLNLSAGQTAAVLAIATVGTGGKVSLYNSAGNVHVVADVQGWFTTGGDFVPLSPQRLLDTRAGNAPLCAGCSTSIPFQGWPGMPAGATAVYLSVTAVWPSEPTYLTVHPHGAPVPNASNVNATAGDVVPNLVVADARSVIDVYNSAGKTHVLVDVLGYSTAPDAPATAAIRGTVGSGLSLFLTGSTGLTWSVLPGSGSLPPGLSLDPKLGLIGGSPTVAGTYTFTVEGTDPVGQTIDTVITAGIAIAIAPSALSAAEIGVPYASVAPVLTGCTAPCTWKVLSGALPTGLTLDPATGVISGTPTASGSTSFSLQVTDANGGIGVRSCLLTVYPHLSHGVFGWGLAGQYLGGSAPSQQVVVQADGLTDVVSVAPAGVGGVALKSDGTVWAWGNGTWGLLGNGTSPTTTVRVPGRVSRLSGIVSVGATAGNGFAVASDGSVWGWGGGGSLLGQTTAADSNVPVRIPGLSRVVAVQGALSTAYALTSDGTVWAWGAGAKGQLGDGTFTSDQPTPVQVAGLPKVTTVSSGPDTTYAVGVDGSVWAWGWNMAGELGNGTLYSPSAVPVQVSGLTGVKAVAAGTETGYALKSDGTVWAWGAGGGGLLGNGLGADSKTPVQVSGLTGITAIASTDGAAYALTGSGQVWAWGINQNGELPSGEFTGSSAFTPIPATLLPRLTSIFGRAFSGVFG